MIESATPETIGEVNRKLILDYIRKHGPVSRADLHRSLDMSFPTVSSNVKRLLEANYIFESGDGDNSLGRKSTLLSFNESRAYVVGIDLGRSQIRVMLADLCGCEVGYIKEDCVRNTEQIRNITKQLCHMVQAVVESAKLENPPIHCICLGVPGIPNLETGELLAAPFIETLNLREIRDVLESSFRTMVLIDNSVNYGAIGEKWLGVAQGYRNIMYINYGVGIGGALILNGELYRGVNNAAGEIGFMVLGNENRRDRFEEQGVLETLISGYRVQEELDVLGMGTDIYNVVDSTSSDDKVHAEIVRNLIDYVGIALTNMAAMFDPEIIVLGGGFGDSLGQRFIPEWLEMMEKHIPFVPKLVVSKLQARANVLGAVAVAIRQANDSAYSMEKAE